MFQEVADRENVQGNSYTPEESHARTIYLVDNTQYYKPARVNDTVCVLPNMESDS